MSSTGYKLLGFSVWHGARWYLRRRIKPRRSTLARTLVGGTALLAGAAFVRRLSA